MVTTHREQDHNLDRTYSPEWFPLRLLKAIGLDSHPALERRNLIRIAVIVSLATLARAYSTDQHGNASEPSVVHQSEVRWLHQEFGPLSLKSPFALERDLAFEQRFSKLNSSSPIKVIAYSGYDATGSFMIGVVRRSIPSGVKFDFNKVVYSIVKEAGNYIGDPNPKFKITPFQVAGRAARVASYEHGIISKSVFVHDDHLLWQIITIGEGSSSMELMNKIFRSVSFPPVER